MWVLLLLSSLSWPAVQSTCLEGLSGAVCSSNGICENDACVCNEGFSGHDPFINLEGQDCQVVEGMVLSAWVIVVAALVGLFMSVLKGSTLYFSRGKKFDRMVKVCLAGAVHSCAMIMNHIFIALGFHIYDSLAFCIGYALWGLTYWPSAFMWVYMMLPITAMNKIEGKALQKRFRPVLIANTTIGVLGFSLPAILLGFVPGLARFWLRITTGALGVCCGLMGLIFHRVIGKLAKAVKKEWDNAKTDMAKKKRYKKMHAIHLLIVLLCEGCAMMFFVLAIFDWTVIRLGHTFMLLAAVSGGIVWIGMMAFFKTPKFKVVNNMISRASHMVAHLESGAKNINHSVHLRASKMRSSLASKVDLGRSNEVTQFNPMDSPRESPRDTSSTKKKQDSKIYTSH